MDVYMNIELFYSKIKNVILECRDTIPCHFLADNICTIYPQRFHECREFPHLHKPGFVQRFPGTIMHYARCPIIFNVIEELKRQLLPVNVVLWPDGPPPH